MKIRVAILFGGKSAEHEVSMLSAKSVIDAIDKKKYDTVLIGISKAGEWILLESVPARWPKSIPAGSVGPRVALVAGRRRPELVTLSGRRRLGAVDVAFPVLHGPFGEDGTLQGLLKLADVPFVGAGVVGSALGMDKDVMKRLLREAGVRTARFLTLRRAGASRVDFADAARQLGSPLFVKPANLGSSVGIAKASDKDGFERAVRDALCYDDKILVEEFIRGRELECSVLGNDDPIASLPGEVIPQHEFYSYEAKYLDEQGARFKIPAELPEAVVKEVQQTAIRAYQTLCCEGMARVDFFLRDEREVIVNEINTIPGFTKISMYPKMWEASGIPFPQLIDRLIRLALERAGREKKLKTSFAMPGR